MKQRDIVLLEGARTPFVNFNGKFKDITAIELGVIAAKEAIKKANISSDQIDQVVFGNVQQSSKDAHLLARHIGLKVGTPIHVPAVTINRVCGTGIEVILAGARHILAGEADVVLAGGTENMSQVPHVVRGMRSGSPLGAVKVEDWLWEGLEDTNVGCTMAQTAENLAEKYEISREEVDQHALSSHQRAICARDNGYFKEEIVSVTVKGRKGEMVVDEDDHIRETSMEQLAKLKPRFVENGVVTPGNASGMVDGAAAVVIATSEYAERNGLRPIARLVAWDVVGVQPEHMGIGPVPAIRGAVEKAKLTVDDLNLIEINEAFSAQYVACQKELGFNLEKGNVNGGAIAIGHPLAASGTRISLSLIYELRRRHLRFGVSSACIGGGQGIAAVWEAL
ncbi:acetyl-CoA acetyltransferase [Virgibacillus pantothenticus]|uniref:acetyl-CoA C-acetyltransferase n=1 Tax=Virgibacillus TaxID=84406 RepID=UPI00090ACC83|nr:MULTISPECIES: acetyl-CoA C-acetyltransferase [Virgibacillus]API93044.1 beta-ketoadipyl CoA thiolase [Virgibacillus sp. 6R]MBS7429276.1 acetyl-CoA C-acetyltransferase [Virgibacillus sp. 19R1-5]MBU8567082.1 acetyl-CoA C-acetyltransferase [Virgibacillus pantothenticus]MBU8600886.1 acetyl-CoA C-acetyltransferase [Virgibacillus pantothenticus]MBU8635234.1 acetyl-CoA C-acetyltransferase [Virgibacillus pantothenticus]